MTREYWNEGFESEGQQPVEHGVLKSLVTLLGLVLALALYLLPNDQRLWLIALIVVGGALIWFAYGLRPRSRAHSR